MSVARPAPHAPMDVLPLTRAIYYDADPLRVMWTDSCWVVQRTGVVPEMEDRPSGLGTIPRGWFRDETKRYAFIHTILSIMLCNSTSDLEGYDLTFGTEHCELTFRMHERVVVTIPRLPIKNNDISVSFTVSRNGQYPILKIAASR